MNINSTNNVNIQPITFTDAHRSHGSKADDDLFIQLRSDGLNFKEIATHFPGKTESSCKDHCKNHIEPQLHEMSFEWTSKEETTLKELVVPILQAQQTIDWKSISEQIKTKTPSQCYLKWENQKLPLQALKLSDESPANQRKIDLTPHDPFILEDERPAKRHKTDLTPSETILPETFFGDGVELSGFDIDDQITSWYTFFNDTNEPSPSSEHNPTTTTTTTTTSTTTSSFSHTSKSGNTADPSNISMDEFFKDSTKKNNSETSSAKNKKTRWDPDLKERLIDRIHALMNLNKKIIWEQISEEFPNKGMEKCRDLWRKVIEPKLKREYETNPAWSEAEENLLIKLAIDLNNDWIQIASHFTYASPTECRLYYTYRLQKKKGVPRDVRSSSHDQTTKTTSIPHYSAPVNTPGIFDNPSKPSLCKINLTPHEPVMPETVLMEGLELFDSNMDDQIASWCSLFSEVDEPFPPSEHYPTATTTSTTFPFSDTSKTRSTTDLSNISIDEFFNDSPEKNSSETSSEKKTSQRWDPNLKARLIERIHALMNLNKQIIWKQIGEEFPNKGVEKCRDLWRKRIEPKLKREYETKPAWSEAEENLLIKLAIVLKNDWIQIASHFKYKSPTECRLYYTYRLLKKKGAPRDVRSSSHDQTTETTSIPHYSAPVNIPGTFDNPSNPSLYEYILSKKNNSSVKS